jgi:hypothetical protein
MRPNDTAAGVLKTPNGSLAVERSCEVCGETFLAMIVRAERGQARFCSRPCSGQSRNRHVTCTCLTCGTTFEIKASAQARGEGLYCSGTCYRATITGVERVPLAERFWSKVDKNGPVPEHCPELGPCWVWTGHIRKDGYGAINIDGVSELTHRVSYLLNIGPLTLWALHKCDNRPCVRPDHLFEGTHDDNMADMQTKGRGHSLRGELNGYAKLTDERVREIRRLDAEGWPEILIADEISVHQTTVHRVLAGKTWRHVE